MKNPRSVLAVSALFFTLAMSCPLVAGDATPSYMRISSPDHPQTWVVGGNQQSKKLRWDVAGNQLVADVRYSNTDYADSMHPPRNDDHTLAFPSVRLTKGGDLCAMDRMGNTATIGHLQEGLFGKEVVLNKGVDLRVNRVHGLIQASLVYNALAAR